MASTLSLVKTGRYAGGMPNGFFKVLTKEEQYDYRKWVRDNYVPGSDVNPAWHPVIRDECRIQDALHLPEYRKECSACCGGGVTQNDAFPETCYWCGGCGFSPIDPSPLEVSDGS